MTKTKVPCKKASKGEPPNAPVPEFHSRKVRLEAGKALVAAVKAGRLEALVEEDL